MILVMFKIEEVFLKGKKADRDLCEDGLVLSDNYVCVVDGASSSEVSFLDGKKSGRWICEKICDALRIMSSNIACLEVLDFINSYICECYKKEGIYEYLSRNISVRPCATTAIFCLDRREVVIVGDCQCIMNGEFYKMNNRFDDLMASIRSTINQLCLEKGSTEKDIMQRDIGRECILPGLNKRKIFQNSIINNEFTYYAIDGFSMPSNGLKCIKIKKNHMPVILATDGYPKLYDTLEESEAYLKYILREDPLCIKKFQSTKGLTIGNESFDDRAYIKIRL